MRDHDDPPRAVVSARGAGRIRGGHPWVFRDDVVRGPARDAGDGGPTLVTVEDGRGKPLGAARTVLSVPLLDKGEMIGAFFLCRQHVQSFTDKQIKLVQHFATQAVIARRPKGASPWCGLMSATGSLIDKRHRRGASLYRLLVSLFDVRDANPE